VEQTDPFPRNNDVTVGKKDKDHQCGTGLSAKEAHSLDYGNRFWGRKVSIIYEFCVKDNRFLSGKDVPLALKSKIDILCTRMTSGRQAFSSIVTLVAPLLGVVVFVAIHHDLDGTAGSGRPAIESHADADNCHHFDASHVEPCAICSGSFNGTTAPAAAFIAHPQQGNTSTVVPLLSPAPSIGVHVTAFRRGPPAVTGSLS